MYPKWIDDSVDSLFKEAVQCDFCFNQLFAENVPGNIPQPRWIGPLYADTQPRILVMLLNPGSGKGYKQNQSVEYDPLVDYKAGKRDIEEYLIYQKEDMKNWGHGKFIRFYQEWLDLPFESISFANIAWCATENNDYPSKMLNACFHKHTMRLIRLLSPNIILLSGNKTWVFENLLKESEKNISVINVFHYANRKSEKENKEHTGAIRQHLKRIL